MVTSRSVLLLAAVAILALSAIPAVEASNLEKKCDTCHTVVEEFWRMWLRVIGQGTVHNKAQQQDAGAKPPSITYDDDIEEAVQTLCTSKRVKAFDDDIADACKVLMHDEGHLRKMVSFFLSTGLDGRDMPEKITKICVDLAGWCPEEDPALKKPATECDWCKATVLDIMASMRRVHGYEKPEFKPKHVYETMSDLCDLVYMRYQQSDKAYEFCDNFVDEYEVVLAEAISSSNDYDDVANQICVEETRYCGGGAGKKHKKKKGRRGSKDEL